MSHLILTGRAAGFALTSAVLASLLLGCNDSSDSSPLVLGDDIQMNQVQYLGSHNSYHIRAQQDLFDLLLAFIPDVAPTLDYTHVPLQEQFDVQGIRQIELDVFDDPQGKLYANRAARTGAKGERFMGVSP